MEPRYSLPTMRPRLNRNRTLPPTHKHTEPYTHKHTDIMMSHCISGCVKHTDISFYMSAQHLKLPRLPQLTRNCVFRQTHILLLQRNTPDLKTLWWWWEVNLHTFKAKIIVFFPPQSTSAILMENMDLYMLNPCSNKIWWVPQYRLCFQLSPIFVCCKWISL